MVKRKRRKEKVSLAALGAPSASREQQLAVLAAIGRAAEDCDSSSRELQDVFSQSWEPCGGAKVEVFRVNPRRVALELGSESAGGIEENRTVMHRLVMHRLW